MSTLVRFYSNLVILLSNSNSGETKRSMTMLPEPLCKHPRDSLELKGHKALCSRCGSFWDRATLSRDVAYDESYAELRSHFDLATGMLKLRSFRDWLETLELTLNGLSVCEIGYGGGHCLQYLQHKTKAAFGIEASLGHIRQAEQLGISRDRLFLFSDLPQRIEPKVDLWVFQDSFEHLPDPDRFTQWMAEQSSAASRILLVLPQAGSLSERVLGRFWPHRVTDHRFHWSKAGITEFFHNRGFRLTQSFHPAKHLSVGMMASHIGRIFNLSWKASGLPGVISFNIGEMGLVFQRGLDEP